MQLTITSGSKTTQAWDMTTSVVWSGDKRRAARTLSFGLAASENDPGLPAVDCPLGAQVRLLAEDGTPCFLGVVVSRTLATGGTSVNIVAHDRGLYLANNQGTYQFRDETAERGTARICGDYGIAAGALATTGVALRRKFAGVALWQIIITLYTLAAQQTGRTYMARFTGDGALEVVERTETPTSLVIRPGSNLLSASTTDSILELCNSVAIYDNDGQPIQTLQNQELVNLYGLMQRHIRQAKGDNAVPEAQAILRDQGIKQTVTVECLGNTGLITGATVVVRQPYTGLSGVFWIDGDSHTWKNGAYTTKLTLNCRNVMFESTAGGEL